MPAAMEQHLEERDAYIPLHAPKEEAHVKEKQEVEGKALLERTCDLLLNRGIETTSVLARGDAATEIIDYVDKEKIDLIVAGSRGLGTFQSWLMGSVSRKLVHYSNCSVLIVKQPEVQKPSDNLN
jgi:nucleotide-binding universal stress UspA family protein